ncbi:hypothetical protein GEMRC1_004402 [Eukaryota sp. GEM-RC1]
MSEPAHKMCRSSDDSLSTTGSNHCVSLSETPFPSLSSTPVRLQQTLVVFINSHLLRRRMLTHFEGKTGVRARSVPFVLKAPHPSIKTVAYVSQRFLDSVNLSVKLFFETNVFLVDVKELHTLSSIASHFGATIKSFSLSSYSSFEPQDILSHLHVISGLEIYPTLMDLNFITNSSPFFLPSLKQLKVKLFENSEHLVSSLFKCLESHSSIQDLEVEFRDVEIFGFGAVFLKNNTLKKVTLSGTLGSRYASSSHDASLFSLFTSISRNSSINTLNIFRFTLTNPSVMIPLFSSTTLRSLILGTELDSSTDEALRNNSSIREITVQFSQLKGTNCNSLMSMTALQKLEIRGCYCDFSTIFKSLELNSSLLELSIHQSKRPLSDQEVQDLVSMLKNNTGLLVVTLDDSVLNFSQSVIIIKGLVNNSTLKKVDFPNLQLTVSQLIQILK